MSLPDELSPRRPPRRPLGASLVVQGGLAALGAAVIALVLVEAVVLLAWAGEARGSSTAPEVVRLAVDVWLLSLHTRLHRDDAVLGFAPLGLTAVSVALVARGTAHLVRVRRREPAVPADRPGLASARIVCAVAAPYGLLAGVVAGAADSPALHPSPTTARVGGFTVGLAGAGLGVLRAGRDPDAGPGARLPVTARIRGALAAGTLAAGIVVAGGALVGAAAVADHARSVTDISAALKPGAGGGAAVTALEATLVPNAAGWGVAWLTGPGFAVGAGTAVTPTHTALGRLPALPLVGALPANGHRGPGLLVVVVPVCAGLVAGILLRRRVSRLPRGSAPEVVGDLTAAACAGLCAVGWLALVAAVSGGPAGSGRMLTLGPSWWRVGLAGGGEVLGGVVLAVVAALAWRHRPASLAVPASVLRGAGRLRGAGGLRTVPGRVLAVARRLFPGGSR